MADLATPSPLDQFIAEPAGDGLEDGAPVELREPRAFTERPPARPMQDAPPIIEQDTGDHSDPIVGVKPE